MTPLHGDRSRRIYRSVVSTPQLRRVGWAIAALSFAAIIVATLVPEVRQTPTSLFCVICGSRGGVDAILNVLLFLPFGIGLSLTDARWRAAVITLCSLSVLIEAAQFFIIAGRNATLGDVVTNSIGGAVGFAMGRYANVWARPSRKVAMRLATGWGMCWIVLQAGVSFAFAPALPNSRYYGQIARSFADLATFRGEVVTATVGFGSVPNSAVPNSQALRKLLRDGSLVSAVVIPAGSTTDIAPILRVADAERREILILAQRGGALVFGVRNGGAVLRLRPTLFSLSDAFRIPGGAPDKPATDTLMISGRYGPRAVTMRVERKSTALERRFPLSASLGWTLISPVQWYLSGSAREHFFTLLWTASLLLPLGFWILHIEADGAALDNVASWKNVVITSGALLGIGLLLVPYCFGLAAPSISDWLAALCGLGAGAGLARGSGRERTNTS